MSRDRSTANSPNAPIGIFDSGIGGLTVVNAIRKRLPQESFLYFGDTAHLPYGDKSAASIRSYARRITRFLFEQGCKAVVIACNTASSYAFRKIEKEFREEGPVLGVIEPVAEYVAERYSHRKVGVIGTKGTINSRVYVNRIRELNPDVNVTSLSTPLLAPMIEEGFFNNNISRTIIGSYLSKHSFQGVEAVILGCTHYPLIRDEIRDWYERRVEVIDPSEMVALGLEDLLRERDMLSERKRPEHRFYVSDLTTAFEKSTRLFFGGRVHLSEWRIWDQPYLNQEE